MKSGLLMIQCKERSVFLLRHSLFSWLYLEALFLLEVRILPAACELREAYVFPPI